MIRRPLLALSLVAALAGCAGLNTLQADVSTYGEWPAGRSAGTYAFDRLPSQQAQPDMQAALENAASPALAQAGFRPAAAGESPDVLVQLGSRITRTDRGPWDDPLWWSGGFGWRHGPWGGPRWSLGVQYSTPRYEREVALLLRDRASGRPLYEARASNDGVGGPNAEAAAAMFRAAMVDFPRSGVNPRSVTVPLTVQPPAK